MVDFPIWPFKIRFRDIHVYCSFIDHCTIVIEPRCFLSYKDSHLKAIRNEKRKEVIMVRYEKGRLVITLDLEN